MSYFKNKNNKECKGEAPARKVNYLAIDCYNKQYVKITAQTFVEARQKAVAKLNTEEKYLALMCDYKEVE